MLRWTGTPQLRMLPGTDALLVHTFTNMMVHACTQSGASVLHGPLALVGQHSTCLACLCS